jgi:glycerol-3-phosphate acyltransferase PlsY
MYVSDCIQIIILGYALGSIPFGVLLAKIFRLPDPRYIGSGNIGATNMLRAGNKRVALLTLVLDASKGAAAVLITRHLFRTPVVPGCIGDCPDYIYNYGYEALAILCAAVGHMYSPLLNFKGGKGVATLFGGTLALSWPVGMAGLFIWLIVMFLTSYVSLASILALLIAPLVAWLRVDGISAFILAIAAAIAIWKHRDNIKRLRNGFEPRMRFSKRDDA